MTHIREARPEDIGLIAGFIRKLAEYVRLSDRVTCTERDLERHLFGDHRAAQVLIAECEGSPAGFAVYYTTFSTFSGVPGLYLEDLFIDPKARGTGIGQALLARLAAIAVERGADRLSWAVLDWNVDAKGFYRRIGGVPEGGEWEHWRLSGDALHEFAASDAG
ncbi:GNAT family N-acetyltransferase [Stakelama tenebrarum]|uniref:GNAT family N-acetyltransferase n=1 Tax=Stakelama tenebrarum TaxID=2711215 RepID=A0A6G6Y9I1_9SPHN|nr:GNAT family N-acetyltransferase [Sphingosinithalassobacter tenebrarum]QIG81368.1 GNAT family N-acetyltransferase [Sphingosinithalassobacter tenebrarum]